ncbi:MAG: hypothetical protein ACT4P4_23900 [Betaproteobacteria bacterium]
MRTLLMAVALLGVAASAEREQLAEPQSEKRYQGKPDTPAWGNGDRAAWETQIKARQLAQHEHRRIYQ